MLKINMVMITREPTQCSICGRKGFKDEEQGGAFLNNEIVCPGCVDKVKTMDGLELIEGSFKLAVIKKKGPGKVEVIK